MKAKKICAGAMALVLSMGTMSAFTGCGSSTDSSSKAVTPEVSQADIKDSFDAKGENWKFLRTELTEKRTASSTLSQTSLRKLTTAQLNTLHTRTTIQM